MQTQNIDRGWKFGLGLAGSYSAPPGGDKDTLVNLPHDYMIAGEVTPDAPADIIRQEWPITGKAS